MSSFLNLPHLPPPNIPYSLFTTTTNHPPTTYKTPFWVLSEICTALLPQNHKVLNVAQGREKEDEEEENQIDFHGFHPNHRQFQQNQEISSSQHRFFHGELGGAPAQPPRSQKKRSYLPSSEYAPSLPEKMDENFHYHHHHQQQQQLRQLQQEKVGRPSRLGLRSTGGGEIVEVQGGHIVRSTGRKDRHSKVCTAKGPRDRRVRLSAHTAIQFYDVQDRLGYDRPSKAVDWLIKQAKASIDELAELPAWKPTADSTTIVNFEQNPSNENLNHRRLDRLEEHEDEDIADNHMGNTQNSSFLPTSLDSNSIADTMKSFFPMGASSAPPPPDNNSSAMQFHQNFPPSELLSRTTSQNQDLKLSLQSRFEDPILQHQQPPPHHHQTEQSNNIFFDNSAWPENGGFQRLVACGNGGTGDAVSGGFAFNSPPTQTPPFLRPFLGQTTNNQLLNYISQRGPLQSSITPPVRAWVDPPPFTGVAVDQHQTLAFHHPSSMPGFTSVSGGFSGFHIPARFQGDEEEHDGISDKPSSASSDSRN